jgi:hypothetical protein
MELNSCCRWQEIFEHIGFSQCPQAFGAISEMAQLFGIRNSESVILVPALPG